MTNGNEFDGPKIRELIVQLTTKLALIADETLPIDSRLALTDCREMCSQLRTLVQQVAPSSISDPAGILPTSHGEQIILAIDDDPDILRTLIFLFKRKPGFRVVAVDDPRNALTMLQTLRPDVILMDLMMPHMTGFELLQRLRAHPEFATTPIAVGSSRSFDKDRLEVLRAGANEFIAKPYNFEELALRLHNLCRKQ